MTPLLQIKDLSVEFVAGQLVTKAVSSFSLTVERGETVAIVGESGSGKSVTALSILQLLPMPPARITSGEILFSPDGAAGIDLLHQSSPEMRSIRGNRIGMIFQEPMTSLNPVMNCGSQVVEAIRMHTKISATEAKEKTISLFDKVKLPDPKTIFSRYPHQLSGGQKQRVMIAMAMSCHPSLLICDEPTTALDVTVQKTILELIKDLQQSEQMGVLFITHDLGVVSEIADRALVMYKGYLAEQGPVREIFAKPKHPYTIGLLKCRPLLHPKGERLPTVSDFLNPTADSADDKINFSSLGSSSNPSVLPDAPHDGKKLLEVEDLHVWFPSAKNIFGKTLQYFKAVNGVNFNLQKGEVLGLVGESGCGKTTLGRALLRLIKPISGKILFNGQELNAYDDRDLKKLRREIQIVFQDPFSSLNPRLKIGDAIAEPLNVHGLAGSKREARDRVVNLLEQVDMKSEHLNRYPHEFSGGQRQRIVIARALALNPSFIVFDESVSALDVSVQSQILNLINDLKKRLGFTVVFISHDLSVIRYISDRIMVMNNGKIEEIGLAEELYQFPKSEYTKRLIESIPGQARQSSSSALGK